MAQIIKVDPENIHDKKLMPAVAALQNGGLCVFPTETVYGLGATFSNVAAVSRIFEVKGRPQDNPLIVHISDVSELHELVKSIPEAAQKLANRFWGGPLTMILERSEKVPDIISAGLPTVAVRLPSHPVAAKLIRLCGAPIAAPSANTSGRPSPTDASHAAADLEGLVDVIIDGGRCFFGIESTVIDLTCETPTILRPGAVTYEELCGEIGSVAFAPGGGVPKSPGMKYRHYAPHAPIFIVESGNAVEVINSLSDERTGVLCYGVEREKFTAGKVFDAGADASEYAARLFYYLREFDEAGVTKIFAMPPPPGGIGDAVRNRIYKAGEKVL